ncbi:hypothetical protein PFICI_05957 [Pestalotiopsis fici W106-1]|uniref:Uncharacterized protein n=1 Tax=Pestalotiopsis fici (strain W106-1 / CGMCC3.15140) TaxID=1229662 RepID=W3XFU0_PESFW|nr:uncharacterized protein PFICI_05957 [Pestalotiopsis fici W106-1]ETS84081.1 hypothetical protein PFICI_05957 [Pestalotiopsis fici W106-1]
MKRSRSPDDSSTSGSKAVENPPKRRKIDPVMAKAAIESTREHMCQAISESESMVLNFVKNEQEVLGREKTELLEELKDALKDLGMEEEFKDEMTQLRGYVMTLNVTVHCGP